MVKLHPYNRCTLACMVRAVERDEALRMEQNISARHTFHVPLDESKDDSNAKAAESEYSTARSLALGEVSTWYPKTHRTSSTKSKMDVDVGQGRGTGRAGRHDKRQIRDGEQRNNGRGKGRSKGEKGRAEWAYVILSYPIINRTN